MSKEETGALLQAAFEAGRKQAEAEEHDRLINLCLTAPTAAAAKAELRSKVVSLTAKLDQLKGIEAAKVRGQLSVLEEKIAAFDLQPPPELAAEMEQMILDLMVFEFGDLSDQTPEQLEVFRRLICAKALMSVSQP